MLILSLPKENLDQHIIYITIHIFKEKLCINIQSIHYGGINKQCNVFNQRQRSAQVLFVMLPFSFISIQHFH